MIDIAKLAHRHGYRCDTSGNTITAWRGHKDNPGAPEPDWAALAALPEPPEPTDRQLILWLMRNMNEQQMANAFAEAALL